MNFTKEVPTRPGFYAWRLRDSNIAPSLAEVYERNGELRVGFIRELGHIKIQDIGGEWCRLVAAAEVALAWEESRESKEDRDWGWISSRAKRVAEGEE